MATKMLESGALSAFCESLAIMYSAGIQTDEALYLLGEEQQSAGALANKGRASTGSFKSACSDVYAALVAGKSLAAALEESGAFPTHLVNMVGAGETSGRLESVLWSLAKHYDEEDRLYAKMRSAVAYPAALLCVMTVILLFSAAVILPVFVDVYEGLTGNLTASSFAYVNVSIGIGWAALIITFLCTVLVLVGMAIGSTPDGRAKLVRLFEKLPITREPMRQIAVARFTAALATFVSAGVDTDTSMQRAVDMVEHAELKSRLAAAHETMVDPAQGKSLPQAISESDVIEPVYARMLMVGSRTGSLETVLGSLSDTFFDDAITRIDNVIDSVEPTLAAFLTVSIGATLIAVMLPLIGIMSSIG
ncbi:MULTISPECIES: type II secretion system F family protein [unclassified Adlercreutzia]|uniref:type II secretion system F family protein n=1 Tax=unclassified Adlercreutzia TaxID=2636013 RepID=UPI0013EBFDEC|nr:MULTISPECIES: type II secretion system F family protein [unclassified Adlercreutzia]